MLSLVDAARVEEGLSPLALCNNPAAQEHAEASLAGGFLSHWDLEGHKPGMRYSLAGGYQRNQENVFRSRCRGGCSFDLKASIREAIELWMRSPGHRKVILDPTHRLLNIGLAWRNNPLRGEYVFHAVHQFEGDYVQYSALPAIDSDGRLSMTGSLRNGATLNEGSDLSIQVYYDPSPQPVTLGQLQRVAGMSVGLYVAKLRRPLPEGRIYTSETGTVDNEQQQAPYDIPANVPSATSWEEENELREIARSAGTKKSVSTRHRITSDRWDTSSTKFAVEADFSDVLAEYGSGVYDVVVRALLNGEVVIVSEYSIFHVSFE